jgi:hypothetical protein
LVNPKPDYIVAEFKQALVSDLVAPTQLAGPIAMISFAIDFDRQPAITLKQHEVEDVFFDWILGNRTKASVVKRFVKKAFPI